MSPSLGKPVSALSLSELQFSFVLQLPALPPQGAPQRLAVGSAQSFFSAPWQALPAGAPQLLTIASLLLVRCVLLGPSLFRPEPLSSATR